MYYANCEWYVDMGEYNKPLCERKSLRPAKCSECSVYIRSIEEENAKLRELVVDMWHVFGHSECNACERFDICSGYPCAFHERMRELGIEVH